MTNRLAELAYKIQGPQDRSTDQLAARYLYLDPPAVQPDYEGSENPQLDGPIAVGELEHESENTRKDGSTPFPLRFRGARPEGARLPCQSRILRESYRSGYLEDGQRATPSQAPQGPLAGKFRTNLVDFCVWGKRSSVL